MRSVKRCSWADAMIALISEIYDEIEPEQEDAKITLNFHIAFEKLKPSLQTYFPEWEQTLVIAKGEFTEANYTFKVTLLDAWRRIAIPSTAARKSKVKSQKSKVKSQKADSVGFSLLWNGRFIYAEVY